MMQLEKAFELKWTPFVHNEIDYSISNDGQVFSKLQNRLLKGCVKGDGYKMYFLKISDGFYKWFYAHRLTGEHFIKNQDNLPEINHNDLDKLNNRETNLFWCSHKDNLSHARKNKKWKWSVNEGRGGRNKGFKMAESSKEKMRLKKIGELHPRFKGYYIVYGIRYVTTYDAAKATGLNRCTISNKCKSKEYNPNFYFENYFIENPLLSNSIRGGL